MDNKSLNMRNLATYIDKYNLHQSIWMIIKGVDKIDTKNNDIDDDNKNILQFLNKKVH